MYILLWAPNTAALKPRKQKTKKRNAKWLQWKSRRNPTSCRSILLWTVCLETFCLYSSSHDPIAHNCTTIIIQWGVVSVAICHWRLYTPTDNEHLIHFLVKFLFDFAMKTRPHTVRRTRTKYLARFTYDDTLKIASICQLSFTCKLNKPRVPPRPMHTPQRYFNIGPRATSYSRRRSADEQDPFHSWDVESFTLRNTPSPRQCMNGNAIHSMCNVLIPNRIFSVYTFVCIKRETEKRNTAAFQSLVAWQF